MYSNPYFTQLHQEWFSTRGTFAPTGLFGNVWRHFCCHNWGGVGEGRVTGSEATNTIRWTGQPLQQGILMPNLPVAFKLGLACFTVIFLKTKLVITIHLKISVASTNRLKAKVLGFPWVSVEQFLKKTYFF